MILEFLVIALVVLFMTLQILLLRRYFGDVRELEQKLYNLKKQLHEFRMYERDEHEKTRYTMGKSRDRKAGMKSIYSGKKKA